MTEIRDAENKNIYKLNGHFEDLFYKRVSILLYKVAESKSNTHLLYNAFLSNDYTDQYIARPHLKGASHKILSMVKNRNPFVTSRVTLKLCTVPLSCKSEIPLLRHTYFFAPITPRDSFRPRAKLLCYVTLKSLLQSHRATFFAHERNFFVTSLLNLELCTNQNARDVCDVYARLPWPNPCCAKLRKQSRFEK